MKVVSLFDGISCLRVALGDREVEYHASEIDPYAIKVSHANYPEIKRLGDVRKVEMIEDVDLLCGGSPCQDLSVAKNGRKGLEGDKSSLFYEYLRILHLLKPKWFILENVNSMPKKDRDIITKEMGVEPIMIDASLVSAQSRKRLFWTNIPVVGLPTDRKIFLKNILQPDADIDEKMFLKSEMKPREKKQLKDVEGKSMCLSATCYKGSQNNGTTLVKVGHIGNSDGQGSRVYSTDGKSVTLSANGGGGGAKTGLYQVTERIRKLTPVECERLQSLPDGYTKIVSNSQRYKCLGNAFNVEVIKFILSFIPETDSQGLKKV
jgi:DNA (cytosine-5)-methyltransferase 3A